MKGRAERPRVYVSKKLYLILRPIDLLLSNKRAQELADRLGPDVECLIALIASARTQKLWHAALALSLFPLSIALVAILEGLGYD